MMTSRRNFLATAGAFGAMGAFGPSLWAAMKYDRDAILEQFRTYAADTDARVKAGIEANRKAPFRFVFKDTNGKLLENVHVKVTQKTHDFKYGADLFMLDEIIDSKEKNEAYKERFAETFNMATLPFYWKDLEPEEGKTRYAKNSPKIYRRPPPDLCVEWCEKNGIEPKAHCLNYHSQAPDWARGDIHKEKYLLEKRFRELSERYAKKIPMWEVTNETFWGNANNKGRSLYHQPDFVEWSFKLAEEYFPANHLIINEWSPVWRDAWAHRDRAGYYMQIERAMLKGARIDAIGMQFHMFFDADSTLHNTRSYYNPQCLFDAMDTYAALGKPLQVTEITIPAFSNDPGDEEVQAEILRELYRIWFSHPAMEAIIYWNLPDGYAWGSEPGDMSSGENRYYGGLCRFDMTPKPALNAVKDLFGKEWRTNFERDVSGQYVFRGFKGTYELEATSNGKTVKKEFRINPTFPNTIEVTI
jgi:GH35 family endo-1,4-beta-xylanase